MSLRSKREILQTKANEVGASEVDILRAALLESQERYNEQATDIANILKKEFERYEKRIQSLEESIRASNEQKAVNVSKALEDAAKATLENIQNKVIDYSKEIERETDKLRVAKEKKSKDDEQEEITLVAKILGGLVLASTIGGYVANWLYGWSNHLPQALKELDKLQPINDALYQIGKQLGL